MIGFDEGIAEVMGEPRAVMARVVYGTGDGSIRKRQREIENDRCECDGRKEKVSGRDLGGI